MLQRVQSIYLFLATALAISFIFTPLAISGEEFLQVLEFIALPIISGVIGFFTFITIFFFKNRKLQLNLCRFAVLLVLGLIGTAVYFVIDTPGEDMPLFGAAFPFVAWLFIFLAMRGIKADENLIRSMDRLR